MRLAVVGATGEVGRMMIKVLQEQGIRADEVDFLASSRSVGKELSFYGKTIKVKELTAESIAAGYDYILMSAGGSVSKQFSPLAAKAGSTVIDNSSAFRMDEAVPLVVPEVNGDSLKGYQGIIANPNCSTIQMVLPLYPLAKKYGLKSVVVATYQSVSGSGHTGIMTLKNQYDGKQDKGCYPRVIFENVVPQIGDFAENGYCEEELKMMNEPAKIMGDDSFSVSATTVRVPVIYGHSESIYAEFEQEVDLAEARALWADFPSITLDAPGDYMTAAELKDSDDSHVSRLRYAGAKNKVTFWNVAHNIRVGAATNAVRILKKCLELKD